MIISVLNQRIRWLHLRQTGFDALDMALTVALLQAGARPISQPPTPADNASVGDDGTLRLTGLTVEFQESRVSNRESGLKY